MAFEDEGGDLKVPEGGALQGVDNVLEGGAFDGDINVPKGGALEDEGETSMYQRVEHYEETM